MSTPIARRSPVVSGILAVLGLLLVLRNVERLVLSIRFGFFSPFPLLLVVVGAILLWTAYRGWSVGRAQQAAAAFPLPPAPAASPAPAAAPPSAVTLAPGTLIPYFVTDAVAATRDQLLRDAGGVAQGARGLLAAGRGLYLTVAADLGQGLSPLFPDDLADRGVSLSQALVDARAVVGRMLQTPQLPVTTCDVTPSAVPAVWQPGVHAVVRGIATIKLVVVGPTSLAASAGATSELYTHCVQALHTTELRMVLPHRDRIFVFADMGDSANEELARGIVLAEAEFAQKPLSPHVYRLDAAGFGATRDGAGLTDLERQLFSTSAGTQRSVLEPRLPADTTWQWDDDKQQLSGRPLALPGWGLAYEFTAGGLRAVRMVNFFAGTWEAFEALDLRVLLPSLDLREHANPWVLANARARLENMGTAAMKRAAMFTAELPGRGKLIGKALAFSWQEQQHYGYELTWLPASAAA